MSEMLGGLFTPSKGGMNFKVDVGNYFGVDHESFLDNMQAFAITKPSLYMKARAIIIERVKKSNMELIYNLFYNLLTSGTDIEGKNSILNGIGAEFEEFIKMIKPNMSNQQVSEKALSAVRTMNKLIDDMMEELIPKNFLKITHDVSRAKTAGDAFSS